MCVCVSTAPGVCVLGWVKCREQISLLVILCIIMCVTKPISDYGKMFNIRKISVNRYMGRSLFEIIFKKNEDTLNVKRPVGGSKSVLMSESLRLNRII